MLTIFLSCCLICQKMHEEIAIDVELSIRSMENSVDNDFWYPYWLGHYEAYKDLLIYFETSDPNFKLKND